MPGGFHPFHAGHAALYNSARRAFPDAEVFVAATNDTSTRPFPFAIKEKLAKLAGVKPGHFVQVKSPFQAKEITAGFNPEVDKLIFVRSEKDADKPPQAGGVKKDGTPSYLQPLLGAKKLEPFGKRAYMAYLPTVEFGPGMTSATEIRTAWPTLNEKRKTALVMSLYPATQSNPALAANVVKMLDTAMGTEELKEFAPNGFNGGDDGEEFNPRLAKMAYDAGFVKGVSLTDAATTQRAMAINDWDKHDGGIYAQHFAKGFIEGRKEKIRHDNKQYNLNLQLMKDGSVRHGEQGVAEGFDREEFRRHMADLQAREELRKTDPVAAKALDLRGELKQAPKKKPEDDSISINDPRHPGYAYTQAGHHELNEGSQVERKIARVQAMIQDFYNRSCETKNDIKRDHYIDMARQLEYQLEGLINDANQQEQDHWEVAQHDAEPSDTWNRGGLEEGEEEALAYATKAHAGQTRSGGDPYITHPMRVADHIRKYKQSHNLDALISAAYLHDTIEDTDTTQEALHDLFGGLVASLVKELTSDPEEIKKVGKAQYLAHKMAAMSSYGLVIKLADRLDNVKDITTAKTPQWRAKYAAETNQILDYIEKTRALSGTHNKLINLIRSKLAEIDNPQAGVAETLAGVSPQGFVGGMYANYQARENQPTNEDYLDE